MTKFGFGPLFLVVLVLGVLTTPGCGNNRQLQSIAVSPAVADAQDFPDGKVQFTAAGAFSRPPTPVSPLTVKWSIGPWFNVAQRTDVTVDSNGVAQCLGFVGTVEVWATAAADPDVAPAEIDPFKTKMVLGTAQLTCP